MSAAPTDELALRVAVHHDAAQTWNLAGVDLDLLVELETATGSATVRTGSCCPIPYPFPGVSVLSVPTTIRLPMDAFAAIALSFTSTALSAVTIRTAGGLTGRILIDDMEVTQ